jgi:hypothetical protein
MIEITIIENGNYSLLQILEPWCDSHWLKNNDVLIEK